MPEHAAPKTSRRCPSYLGLEAQVPAIAKTHRRQRAKKQREQSATQRKAEKTTVGNERKGRGNSRYAPWQRSERQREVIRAI